MEIAVRYYSRSGNTKKLADAVAAAAGTAAQPATAPISGEVDILFLGASLYAGSPDKTLLAFAEALEPKLVKLVVVFGTAGGPKSAHDELKALLEPKGIPVSDQAFQCRGKFLLMNRSHPDQQDLSDAAAFVKRFLA